MISRIRGVLADVDEEAAYIDCGGLVYQVFVPLNTISTLSQKLDEPDAEISLHTIHQIEGGIGSGPMVPRLFGFLTEDDREFFRIFTTVQGFGSRKALKAISLPIPQIVQAIETGNRPLLTKLPGIGKKIAERMISELGGKLARFAIGIEEKPEQEIRDPELVEQSRDILMMRLQFSRQEAEEAVKKVLAADSDLTTVEDVLREVFRQQLKK